MIIRPVVELVSAPGVIAWIKPGNGRESRILSNAIFSGKGDKRASGGASRLNRNSAVKLGQHGST